MLGSECMDMDGNAATSEMPCRAGMIQMDMRDTAGVEVLDSHAGTASADSRCWMVFAGPASMRTAASSDRIR